MDENYSISESHGGMAADAESIDSTDSNYLLDLADETEYEDILPQSNYHSPYYVNVPTPKNSPLGGMPRNAAGLGSGGGLGSEASELYDDDSAAFVREYPTDILADRFHKWRKILKALVIYLREVAYSQEQFARINFSLKNSVKFSFLSDLEEGTNKVFDPLTKTLPQKKAQTAMPKKAPLEEKQDPSASLNSSFIDLMPDLQIEPNENSSASGFMNFGSGSIQDIQVILKKYHLSLSSQQIKASKDLTQQVIPKLEDLRKDLSLKIKEIKELNADFKTNIQEHIALTGQLLHKYIASVNFLHDSSNKSELIKLKKNHALKPKHDPYLLKLQLDLQLKRQLLEENYLQEAYINLQTSGMELEKIIFSEIQRTLQRYSTLIDTQSRLSINNLCLELQQGILSKPPCVEWDSFVSHHPRCLLNWKSTDPLPQPRKLSDIRYPKMKSSLAKCIRAGYLLKKSKYLKQYNKGYFVLTSNYLHEFKSSNFFKLTQDTGENSEHAIIPSSGSNKRSIVPVMSIPLNDSTVVENEDKIVISSKSAFILEDDDNASISKDIKRISKSTASLSKFWKPVGAKHTKHNTEPLKKQTVVEESTNISTISFKKPSDVDMKDFKKWCNNLKDLSSFNNTLDRAKYIEEKILKAHIKVANSSLNLSTMKSNQSSNASFTSQKPHFIQISPAAMNMNMRSRVNTPAIDDNGNLIFASERPKSMHQNQSSLNAPGQYSPAFMSPNSIISNEAPAGSSKTPDFGYVITSNGITPVQKITPIHQRDASGSSIHVTTPTALSGSNTSASNNSAGSGGGYFAIPVRPKSQNSIPSRDVTKSPSVIPKIHVNELESPQPTAMTSFTYAPEAITTRNGPYSSLKKNSSASSVPSVSSLRASSPVFMNSGNNSSTHSLQNGKTVQTQPIRRHKKTVSFNSLNSLMFSKKGGTSANNQYLSDAKINEDDDSGSISLNKSLYS